MKNRGRFAVVSILFLSLFMGVTLAQGQGRHDHFDDHDRQVARDWYHTHPDAFRHDEGVYWHREWEPNIREGFVLTPDMRAGIRPVPHDLLLGPLSGSAKCRLSGDHARGVKW